MLTMKKYVGTAKTRPGLADAPQVPVGQEDDHDGRWRSAVVAWRQRRGTTEVMAATPAATDTATVSV